MREGTTVGTAEVADVLGRLEGRGVVSPTRFAPMLIPGADSHGATPAWQIERARYGVGGLTPRHRLGGR